MNGFDTEILEFQSVAGGQCTAWDRKGYRIDYCLHWLVGTSKGAFHDIWKETRVLTATTEVVDHEIHSQIIDRQGNPFIISANIDRWEKYLLEIDHAYKHWELFTPLVQVSFGIGKRLPSDAPIVLNFSKGVSIGSTPP